MNKFARFVRANKGALVLGGVAASAVPSFAVGTDFTSLTSAIDLSTVATAILAVAALMVVPNVAKWGARKVMSFIR